MTLNPEKAALRKHLLEKRDSTSFDLMGIHSEKILSKLMKTKVISEAESIACYYSIGSEVQTVELITRLLEEKKDSLVYDVFITSFSVIIQSILISSSVTGIDLTICFEYESAILIALFPSRYLS